MKAKWQQVRRAVAPVCAVSALTLAGCTTYVSSQVTAFSEWSGSDATRTYSFDRTPAQQNSLEQATYEQLVASELDRYAFRRVPRTDAHYLVGLGYKTDAGAMTVTQPVYYGNPWPGPFWRPMGPFGPFGAFPPDYVSQTYPVYTHTLGVRITERSTGREVYNVTARTTNDEPSLVQAMPYLARSALADFPLGNGVVRTVRIPVDSHGGAASNEVPVAPPATGRAPAAASVPAAQ
jgi:hypothetical protein